MNKTLYKAIKKAGNQNRLSLAVGESRQFINQIVKGKRPVPIQLHIKLCDYLGITYENN